jgi:plasmid stabilization system protein ParE
VSWRVSHRDAAHTDLRTAHDWYERQQPGLGDDFLLSIADAMIRLEESPYQFPIYYRDFRRVLANRFPYKIFFRIQGDSIIVFRILHAVRDHTAELK